MGEWIKGERIFIAQWAPFVTGRQLGTFKIGSLLPCLWHRTHPGQQLATAPLSIRASHTFLSSTMCCHLLFIHLPLLAHTPPGQLLGLHLSLWSPWPSPCKMQVGVQNLYNYQNSLHLRMPLSEAKLWATGVYIQLGMSSLFQKNIFLYGDNTLAWL